MQQAAEARVKRLYAEGAENPQHAEAQDHHPNWYNVYGTVQIRLSSHDADGVTERDFRLASSIDQSLTDFDYTDLTPTPVFKG